MAGNDFNVSPLSFPPPGGALTLSYLGRAGSHWAPQLRESGPETVTPKTATDSAPPLENREK